MLFTPRREVLIEIVHAPHDFPRDVSRSEMNKYLEKWYNQYPNEGPEPLKLVSLSIWKEELPVIFNDKKTDALISDLAIPEHIEKDIFIHLASISHRS